ncbi:MAG: hypothetical protein HWD85_12860 [Flavobacteriaceae bacterium]|nr:hypothetical protein [Flavobacteriaceae bacterium]
MKNWYKINNHDKNICGNCEVEFEGLQTLDHHSTRCPNCNIESIWFYFERGRTLQIIPENAPKEFLAFIKWSQKELDELEFLELIVSFEEIARAINKS